MLGIAEARSQGFAPLSNPKSPQTKFRLNNLSPTKLSGGRNLKLQAATF